MNHQNHIENVEYDKISGAVTAATTDVEPAGTLMANADNAEIEIGFGAAAGAGTIVIRGSNDDTNYTDLDTIAYTTSVANKLVILEVLLFNYKYLKLKITRAGNNAIENIVLRKRPTRVTPAPANDAVIRRILAYSPATLPNGSVVARTVT